MAKYKIIPSSRTIVQSPISIGHKAEKGVEAIEFDLTAWVETYGSGTLTVIMRRWGDAIPYPVALELDESNKATWTLSDIDTAKAGMAYAQLSYIVGDEVVKKSDIYTFRVMDSLTGEGEPPEAYESWLEHLTHLAAEAMAEVLDIEGIVTDKTLTIDGGIADAKATGDALALKADKSTTYTKTEVDQMIEDVEVETDTTLSVSGAPADAKATGDALGALEDQFTEETDKLKADLGALEDSASDALKVVVNHDEWVNGGINDSGEEAGNQYTIRSGYHRITPDTYIEFTGAFRGQTDVIRSIQAYFYTENKTYIDKVSVNASSAVFIIPDNSAYVRFRYGHISSTGIKVDDVGFETLVNDFSISSYSATEQRSRRIADDVSVNTVDIAQNASDIETLVKLVPNSGAIFTFIDDDGYAEQVEHWAEISKETGIKISECVVTGWVGQEAQAPSAPYLRPLTWDEITTYQATGFEFVSHSHGHAKFGGTGAWSQADLIADVEASQQALSAHNCNPDFLVYPGGHHDNGDNGIVDNVVRTHFKGAVAISNVANTVPLYTYSIFRYSVVDESGGKVEVTDSNGDTRQVYPIRDLQWFKDLVDDAIAGKQWIVFMSHLYNYGNYYYNADVKSRISDVAKYIVQSGGRIMTLSDAFEQRKNLFESAPRHKNVSYIVGYDGGIYDKY